MQKTNSKSEIRNPKSKPIGWYPLFLVGLRATSIMAVWNFERMLNIGFTFSLIPVFRRLYPDKKQRKRVLTRHLEFFNTHPYFASYILGLTAAKEEQLAKTISQKSEAEQTAAENEIHSIKTALMGPLGALGDSFFWTTVRPFLVLIAIMIVLLDLPQWEIAVFGPIVFIVWYNVGHVYVRFCGVFQGYNSGEDILSLIRKFNLARTIETVQTVGVALTGLFIGLSGLYFCKEVPECHKLFLLRSEFAVTLLLISVLLLIGLQKKMHTTRLFLLGLLVMSIYELMVQYHFPQVYGIGVVVLIITVYVLILFWMSRITKQS